MKLDSAGNVYCCGPGGIHVFDPDAHLLEVLEVPERTANFAWGDDDFRVALHHRLDVPVPGPPNHSRPFRVVTIKETTMPVVPG